MNYYSLLKINNLIKNPRLKFLGLLCFHILKKRYISVQFDPVNACNLRCKMCYFTDKDYVKKLKGLFPKEELPLLSKAVLKRAAKLQVGCGTEPTLYKNLDDIFILAQQAKVPYISMTTNANLIEKDTLRNWVLHGLNEITVSLHGVTKESYEHFMGKGNFDRFLLSLQYITEIKKEFPDFKLRINYTFNEDNFLELKDFWKTFKDINIDYLQIRPIDKIGNTEYNNFSLEKILPVYNEVYTLVNKKAIEHNTILIAPKLDRLNYKQSMNSVIRPFTYCYISPLVFWHKDFNWKQETYNQYCKRTGFTSQMIRLIFAKNATIQALQNKSLNYDIN
ncbi:radical SAM protein [Wenyingzhuangia aestuarii]|uniref:radical SAM protein n=1 Tax=Wenyingzhuangia aestuarii TaxID=1647582 RepID=UPI00143A9B02|nr:radical SAM protein [Wenyingzhuangia aestuarii]NJB84036.1 MoaA/NifB/PqqE/SkfB family radical SAM enzyme [Wenyingzhuangia aestuarii]